MLTLKCSKIAQHNFWGRFKMFSATLINFRDFVYFLPILVDFLLNKRFFVGSTSILAERLNSDQRPTIHGHSSRLPDMTSHLPASRPATIAGVFWGRQLG
jgi:hypothetical protein